MNVFGWIATAAALSATPIAAAAGAPRQPPFIALGESADAPVGFVEMCARDAQACGLAPGTKTPSVADCASLTMRWPGAIGGIASCSGPRAEALVTATIAPQPGKLAPPPQLTGEALPRSLHKLLKAVNLRVNRNVLQRSDMAIFGVDEYWRVAGSARNAMGDCEDIALEKRAQLIAAGVPQDKLFFGVVYKRRVGLHTVLLVRTEAGDMVLDNLSDKVRKWHAGGYSWLRVQQPGKPMHWSRPAA